MYDGLLLLYVHTAVHTHRKNDMVSVTKQFRISVEELEEIERHRAATDDDFTGYVLESLRLRRSGQWRYGTNRLKDLNAMKKVIDFEKMLIKKDLHKLLLRRRALREEKLKGEEREVEDQAEHEIRVKIRHLEILRDHLEDEFRLWVNDEDPMDFMIFPDNPEPGYTKLPKGKLNDELNEFYNENIQLLK